MKLLFKNIPLCLYLFSSWILSADCYYDGIPTDELIKCLKHQISHHRLPNTNEFKPLSFCELIELHKQGHVTDEQAGKLINFALENGNPILFFIAKKEVSFSDYSLNFLWINKEKQASGHLIGNNNESLIKNLLLPLQNWQSIQPEANINFWFDGNVVSHDAVKNTIEIVQNHNINLKKVTFRDIRNIELIEKNKRLFDVSIPIYFRVDLAKAIISDHVLRYDGVPYSIIIDSDVTAISREQLFDDKTLDELDNLGYAFGTAPDAHEENSFIMLHNNADLETANNHSTMVIEEAIYNAWISLAKSDLPYPESVYHKYPNFKLTMKDKYRVRKNKPWATAYSTPGKYMIFPKSQHSLLGGYSDDEVRELRKALLTNNSI